MSQDEKFDMRNFFDNTSKEQNAPDIKGARTSTINHFQRIKKDNKITILFFIVFVFIMAGTLFFFLRQQNILFIKHNTKFYIDPKELEDYKHVQPF